MKNDRGSGILLKHRRKQRKVYQIEDPISNLSFFHFNTGIVKPIQHGGVLANKRNLENR